MRGRIVLPEGTGAGSPVRVRVAYSVRESGGEGDPLRIPVARVPWGPEEAAPGTFTARALLGDTLQVLESFPTVGGRVEGEGPDRFHTLDLHVVPSVVTYRLGGSAAVPFGFTRAVDGGVGALLAILGFWGWRALRRRSRTSRRGDAPETSQPGTSPPLR